MSIVVKKGDLPKTPHTEFYAIEGVLSLEEIHGTVGFNGPFTRKNHIRSYPTVLSRPPKRSKLKVPPAEADDDTLQPYHILTGDIPYEGNFLTGLKPILFGITTVVSVSKPTESMKDFFKNGDRHELLFVQDGEGVLKTEYGNINFKKGHYLSIPKGTIYQVELKSENAFFLVIESTFPIVFPPHYMNKEGQATLMSPVVETEITLPEFQKPIDEEGEFILNVKHNDSKLTVLTLNHHPFDLTGWEGSLYPYAFDINDHHGVAREIHTAPPHRQTFQSGDGNNFGFSICTFRSQMEGWHPKDIPAPYAHSNVDSDEVLFFSNTSYEARKGVIQEGSITLHPSAIPHSPHGNAALKSMNSRAKVSKMLAVMLDTFFESLQITDYAYRYLDKDYSLSWYKADKATAGASN